jgi:uncharacterized protein YggE
MTWMTALAVLAAFALARRVPAQEDRRPPSEIRTSATAKRFARPDLATVKLSFTADGATPLEAGRALAARADSLRRALGKLGIPNDSLITASRWYWWRGRIQSVPGSRCVPLPERTPDGRTCMMVNDTTYRAHDAIEVHLHDLSRIGAVLDTAMAHQITDISELQFRATDVNAAYEDALKEATAMARRQADAVAAASGTRVGRILSLSTYQEPRGPYLTYGLAGASVDSGDASSGPGTTVVQPSIPVMATVYARWELVEQP